MRTLFTTIALSVISILSSAQNNFSHIDWAEIESNISEKKNLVDLRNKISGVKQEAIAANNPVIIARCVYDLIRIADHVTEDTLFFKNSLPIDSILNNRQSPDLLKAIMYMVKAKRINAYERLFFGRSNKNLVAAYSNEYDYSKMTRADLRQLSRQQFEAALKISSQLKPVPIEDLLWLSTDPLVFLFKPDFTDIIYGEQIRLLKMIDEGGRYIPKSPKSPEWLTLSQDEFMAIADTLSVFDPTQQDFLKLYKRWIQYHQPNNSEAVYFIETLARKHAYSSFYPDSASKKSYERYLQDILNSPYKAVKATAVYQLFILWNDLAKNYNPLVGNRNYYYDHNLKFDSTYRLYYVKAFELLATHRAMLDSFSFMKHTLEVIEERIKSPLVSIEISDYQLPDQPILTQLKYRNSRRVYFRVIRLHAFEGSKKNEKEKIQDFLQRSLIRESRQDLQLPADYQWHNAFLKLDPLPAGRYVILYSDSAISANSSHVSYVTVDVTNIAVINNDDRVFILNRKTGFPLKDARVRINYGKEQKINGKSQWIDDFGSEQKINESGYITMKVEDVRNVMVYLGQDSVIDGVGDPDIDQSEYLYDKEDYDDLSEYYEENTRIHLFTDRGIYRPGQTVHFKGIFITHDPKTGAPVVLNWKNLKAPFFKKLFFRLAQKFSKEKLELLIQDPFGRDVDTVFSAMPNKYGSFSGSFKIPKDAATGEWEFYSDIFEMGNENAGTFMVEEYKRPSFEITMEKPKNELYLGDSFAVKVLVKSFAGAPLANVRINYTVNANGQLPVIGMGDGQRDEYNTGKLLQGEAFTNDKGEFILSINDSLLKTVVFTDEGEWQRYYEIEAEAVDGTGESHEEKLRVGLSSRPVRINVSVNETLDRSQLPPLTISTKSAFAGPTKKQLEVRLYKTTETTTDIYKETWSPADIWLYSKKELQDMFPELAFDEKTDPIVGKQLIYTTQLTTGGDEKLVLPKNLMECGNYVIETICRENGKITGQSSRSFAVFDKGKRLLPETTSSFHYMQSNTVERGQQINWVTGNTSKDIFSIYHLAYYVKNKKGVSVKYEYDVKPESKGLNEWQHAIPMNAVGEVVLTHLYIFENHLYEKEQRVFVPGEKYDNPEIIVEHYRKKLTPGGKETFNLSVKTKNSKTAVELMTAMYDASLDQLEQFQWRIPQLDERLSLRVDWPYVINQKARGLSEEDVMGDWNMFRRDEAPLGWMSGGQYMLSLGNQDGSNVQYQLQGRIAGLDVVSSGLDEVVVTGYGVKNRMVTSAITVRGMGSLSNNNKALIVIDGVIYEGDLAKFDVNRITDVIVLKGADAAALYGSRAAPNGVIVISTNGLVQLPQVKAEVPVVVRRNFEETAFFFPKVYAGKDGYYNIHFTLPESVTQWKWMMLAHSKKAAFAYAERTIVSQLPLMVQPDMPRFLYQGDKIILKSRVTNLDTNKIDLTLKCSIEDAVTGEDITSKVLHSAQQSISVSAASNTTGAFTIAVPENLLHPLKVKITGASTTFSDGEEMIIPVLSKKILVGQYVPLLLNDRKDLSVAKPSLPADAQPYGIGLSITPKPQAAMINALPYLANYPYNCAEQTFNKLLAKIIAIKMVKEDSVAQSILDKGEEKSETKTESMPDELSEQTMPWLKLNHLTEVHHQQLAKLMDTLRGYQEIKKHFTEIQQMQNADGGITWFKGGKSDNYISVYLLAGFGKLNQEASSILNKATKQNGLGVFVASLIHYCDAQFLNPDPYINPLQYIDARNYWSNEYPLSSAVKIKADSLLVEFWKNVHKYNLGTQAMLISATFRYAKPGSAEYEKASKQLESIRQLAITDEVNGIRWKSIADDDDLNMQTEEWVVRLAEAFESSGKSKEVVKGIMAWLLTAKQEHNWSTTKSTAEVVNLFLRQQPHAIGTASELTTTINEKKVKVSDDLLSGQLFSFNSLAAEAFPNMLSVQKNSLSLVSGGLSYFYFTADPPKSADAADIKISKALFRLDPVTGRWDSLASGATVKMADKIRVVLTIESRRQLQYVFIDDRRAAGLEPADINSGYEYARGFSYYKSVRDVGMQFFANKIPAGISTISYETVVAKEGEFSNGVTAIQCMYQPALRAYCGGQTIVVK